uniref:Uncharacterized protein n=1 Tax=Odontella aurita TaxID=265563 RepID=A0A7S4HNL4_9STRA|mmetsp:Transcript_12823/g.37702  ORF Transcript_12823/g.37702 Transcript_12823/m.37702 type:complete len:138 (+) Transcript_12823:64-477(+)
MKPTSKRRDDLNHAPAQTRSPLASNHLCHEAQSTKETERPPLPVGSRKHADKNLMQLDREYEALDDAEGIIASALEQAKEEERSLRLALSRASETPKERLLRQARERDEEAAARLGAALMASSESESCSSDGEVGKA